MTDSSADITVLLDRVSSGDKEAMDELLPLLYGELRTLARRYFRDQPEGHTLQPTALVHEVFVRILRQRGTQWRGREHFMAVSATAMRQILTDHARKRGASKRGGGWSRVDLSGADVGQVAPEVDLFALDAVLTRLAELNPRHARLVELRVFGGLSIQEAATVLDVSARTVNNDWRYVKAWMRRELAR